jgi:hypothetical protein
LLGLRLLARGGIDCAAANSGAQAAHVSITQSERSDPRQLIGRWDKTMLDDIQPSFLVRRCVSRSRQVHDVDRDGTG